MYSNRKVLKPGRVALEHAFPEMSAQSWKEKAEEDFSFFLVENITSNYCTSDMG